MNSVPLRSAEGKPNDNYGNPTGKAEKDYRIVGTLDSTLRNRFGSDFDDFSTPLKRCKVGKIIENRPPREDIVESFLKGVEANADVIVERNISVEDFYLCMYCFLNSRDLVKEFDLFARNYFKR